MCDVGVVIIPHEPLAPLDVPQGIPEAAPGASKVTSDGAAVDELLFAEVHDFPSFTKNLSGYATGDAVSIAAPAASLVLGSGDEALVAPVHRRGYRPGVVQDRGDHLLVGNSTATTRCQPNLEYK